MTHPITVENTITFRAYYFALEAHDGQTYGDGPYSVHLREAAKIVGDHYDEYVNSIPVRESFFSNEELEAVAYLHDVLEDTGTAFEELERLVGFDIASLVWNLTDAEGANRKERKRKTWHKIRANPASIFVKLADRIANTEAAVAGRNMPMLAMYAKEFPLFEAALYTPNHFEGMWDRLREIHKYTFWE